MIKVLRIGILITVCFICTPSLLFAEDPSRDPFYTALSSRSAPEINTVSENIDPFSGILTLTHTDLHLPGNGGLDVNVMRTYNSMIWGRRDTSFPGLIAVNERSPVGIGWSMHMGIVRNPYGTGSSNRYLPNNPVVEMPDGSMHTLFKDKNDSSRFISRDFWLYKSVGTGKWELTLTDGTVYTFEYGTANAGYNTVDNVQIAQVTSIRNAAGTATINIDYYQHSNGYSYLKTLTDSCNRTVTFNYDYTNHKLTSITVDTRTFSYSYTTTNGQNYLSTMTPPAGNAWSYAYEPTNYELSSITFPTGGQISYGYNDIYFATGTVNVKFRVVVSRTTSGRDITGGSWTYQYSAGGSSGDTTTITGPSVTETHKFYGWGNTGTGNVWKVGLPMSKDYNFNGTTLSESYGWTQGSQVSYDEISNANWNGSIGWVYDSDIYIPFMSSQTIARDGKTYSTSYSSFNTYGDPQSISETGDKNRTTSVSYWTNTIKNIVRGKPSSRTVTGGFSGTSATSRTYDSNSGNILTHTVDSVLTTYTYDSNGNLDTVKDANNKTTSYNWSYGRISSETNPEYSISRSINSNGTVASETNGRSYTTYFTYDKNLRITNIDPPAGNSTSFSYPADNSYKRQTRGGYSIDYLYDGFGRPRGSSDSKGITTTVSYNAYGAKDYTDSNIGDKVYYDYFGRVKQVVHKDSNDITYSYSNSNVTVTDENNGTTVLTYNAFGNPDEKYLASIKDQANNTISYTRNIQGNVTAITQGSLSRTFTYDSTKKNFLASETNPESGTTSYSRDNVGNMTGKTDSTGAKTYSYDGIDRLTGITSGSYSISFGYDDANNRTSMNSPDASVSYTYDSVNRLTQKSETIGGRAYTTGYGYDGNDNITSITYPSGRTISYGYNSNNEVTSITGFGASVTSVNYNTAGLPTSYTYSNGITSSISYNNRNLATGITASSAVNVDYGYDSRGNTTSYINYLDRSKDQSFSYDSLSRLTGFNGAWGTGSFSYSAYGNRDGKTVAGSSTMYSYSNNKLSLTTGGDPASYSYYGNGALSGGTWYGGNYTLTYDAFDNLKTYKLETTTLGDYGYDGDGMRVTKVADGTTTVYHYDQGGRVITENDGSGNLLADYIYLNGKMIAKVVAVSTVPTLIVSKAGTGTGTVTSSPSGISCGSTCSSSFDKYTAVTLTASSDLSSTFTGWSGSCSGIGTCNLTMDSDKNVTANFAVKTYTVTPSAGAGGTISPSTPQTVNYNGTKSFSVTLNTGYHIASVTGCGGTLNGNTYTTGAITADCTVTANFALNTYTLTVSKSGSGTVTSAPSGINCGTVCSDLFAQGTTVTLTAVPSQGYTFTGWSGTEGGPCSGNGACTLTINENKTISAVFSPVSQPLDLAFVIDSTGSMWDDIDKVKASAVDIINKIGADVSDYRIAVVDYKDHPVSPYGSTGDYPYRAVLPFSKDTTAIVNAINSLTASGGADWPESVYSALINTFNAKDLGAWRPEAKKAIILMGDAPPHDPEPITDYTLNSVIEASYSIASPYASKALALRATATSTAPVMIYSIVVGSDNNALEYFTKLSEGTEGKVFTVATSDDVVGGVMDAIDEITTPANRPPICSSATAATQEIWPPNHNMKSVNIINVADPDGDPVTIMITGISQDEPVKGSGSGNTAPDAEGIGSDTAKVRAERTGSINGRVYKISFAATDDKGLQCTGYVMTCVPHDQGENNVCVDDGQLYDSTSTETEVSLPGNIDKTGHSANRVDGYDLITLSIAFGSKSGDLNWNPSCDLDKNGASNNKIDGTDLIVLGTHFGKVKQ